MALYTLSIYSPSDHQLLATNNESGIHTVLDNINWTPEAVDGLQQSVLNNDVLQFCTIMLSMLGTSWFDTNLTMAPLIAEGVHDFIVLHTRLTPCAGIF